MANCFGIHIAWHKNYCKNNSTVTYSSTVKSHTMSLQQLVQCTHSMTVNVHVVKLVSHSTVSLSFRQMCICSDLCILLCLPLHSNPYSEKILSTYACEAGADITSIHPSIFICSNKHDYMPVVAEMQSSKKAIRLKMFLEMKIKIVANISCIVISFSFIFFVEILVFSLF